MGHGDELAIVDGNFPATALARRLVHLSTISAADALDAILTVFPLDTVAKPAAMTMRVIGHPNDVPEPVPDFAAVLKRSSFLIDGTPAGLRPHETILLSDGAVIEVLPAFAGG